jgi:hypothetical protein
LHDASNAHNSSKKAHQMDTQNADQSSQAIASREAYSDNTQVFISNTSFQSSRTSQTTHKSQKRVANVRLQTKEFANKKRQWGEFQNKLQKGLLDNIEMDKSK